MGQRTQAVAGMYILLVLSLHPVNAYRATQSQDAFAKLGESQNLMDELHRALHEDTQSSESEQEEQLGQGFGKKCTTRKAEFEKQTLESKTRYDAAMEDGVMDVVEGAWTILKIREMAKTMQKAEKKGCDWVKDKSVDTTALKGLFSELSGKNKCVPAAKKILDDAGQGSAEEQGKAVKRAMSILMSKDCMSKDATGEVQQWRAGMQVRFKGSQLAKFANGKVGTIDGFYGAKHGKLTGYYKDRVKVTVKADDRYVSLAVKLQDLELLQERDIPDNNADVGAAVEQKSDEVDKVAEELAQKATNAVDHSKLIQLSLLETLQGDALLQAEGFQTEEISRLLSNTTSDSNVDYSALLETMAEKVQTGDLGEILAQVFGFIILAILWALFCWVILAILIVILGLILCFIKIIIVAFIRVFGSDKWDFDYGGCMNFWLGALGHNGGGDEFGIALCAASMMSGNR